MKLHDLVVVGAGPGGLVAGLEGGRLGLDTVVLDKKSEIGRPLRCGEAFSEAVPGRVRLPLDDRYICSRCTRVSVTSPRGRVAMTTMPFTLMIVDRVEFEKMIGERTVDAGTDIRLKNLCTGLRWKKDHYELDVNTPRGKQRLRATYVIGADGVETRVGRWAGLDSRIPPAEMGKAALAIVKNIKVDPELASAYIGGKYASGGYGWVFPKSDRSANIGLGFIGTDNKNPQETLKKFIKKYYPKGRIEYSNVGCMPLTRPLKKMVARNLLLAGDSAHLVIPATGAGVGNACLTGKMAAQTVKAAVEGKDRLDLEGIVSELTGPADALGAYQSAVHRLMDHKFERSLKFRNKLLIPDDEIERQFGFYKTAFFLLRPLPWILKRLGRIYFF